nr:hypothetical protein [Tanacetum cinerariifolium]
KLGLWYSKDTPFELEAYIDSDYTGVKTVNGEEQIQVLVDKKKVIIIETSVRSDLYLEDAEGTECLPTATIVEQLTLMNNLGLRQVKTVNGEEQIQVLVDKKKVIIIETSVRSDLYLEDAEGTECLPTATIVEQLTLMKYENLTQKLTFYKAFFSPQ